jgi:hypothetical protein
MFGILQLRERRTRFLRYFAMLDIFMLCTISLCSASSCRALFRYVPHPHLWGVLGIITDLLLQGSTRRQFGDISVLPGSILQGTLPGYPAVPFSIWFPVSVFAKLISFIIKIHSREASGLPVLT